MKNIYVVIPNFNGADELPSAIESVLAQSHSKLRLIIVDNGSSDNSQQVIETYLKNDVRVRAIWREKNYGYTGGVNPGMELAIQEGADYVAPFNNDAVADRRWLHELVSFLEDDPTYGVATCKLLHADQKTIDSTGDLYTVWGLPYPRGRNEPADTQYDNQTEVFGASGGASLYRVAMLKEVGVLDQDFFAYYEDIDLSFRAQLAGWKIAYVPSARVYHEQSVTSGRMKTGFTTKQYMRNIPMLLIKDVPGRLLIHIAPRLLFAYTIFFANAVFRHGTGWPALQGWLQLVWLTPKKLFERHRIQTNRKVPVGYIWSIISHDLPPNAQKLRSLRASWWRLTGHHK